MLKRSRLAYAVLGIVVTGVLGGCGGAAEKAPAAAASTPAAADKKQQLESVKADCMKQKGFKYVPYAGPPRKETEQDRKISSGDYQAMRKDREKNGFGVYPAYVYPEEFRREREKSDAAHPDPNLKIQSKLSPAQLDAFHKASDACQAAAAKQVLGLTIKSGMDYFQQRDAARKKAVTSELDSDPRLVELAGAMATCLKNKGYSVADTAPSKMAVRGHISFLEQQDRQGREQHPEEAQSMPKAKKGEEPNYLSPELTPEEAKPYLEKEIKAALDDLECGKDFYAAYAPRETAISQQVNDRFPM
ncbi:hypothetical protein HTZ77_19910 [Nonomuraea sp. SMC257]|uniref:Lipoprotein n=1 Tax=Nonomuraea montanisoli TaxID=2741721 RepID=A0A7Y6I8J2_9ACTN|nr:hypothetical protein [Nonomuraea montanisoli]NUW33682.1 hypothetical protein [Nonomuraea montanisoli]